MNTNHLETFRQEFRYLFDQGFTILSSSEDHRLSSTEIGSPEFNIRLDILDGIMDIFVATNYPATNNRGHWYGLAIYVEFFEGHPIDFPTRVVFPSNQLKILSRILETYVDSLRNLSRSGNYEDSEKKLRETAVRISERNWKSSDERSFNQHQAQH
jgi:hypothetical protein